MRDQIYYLYTDGGARGNPGPAAIGGVITSKAGKIYNTFSLAIDKTTNNQAEYRALIHGLELAKKNGYLSLRCYLDSELLVNQLNYKYKVKDRHLAQLFAKVYTLKNSFTSLSFVQIPRERNKHADTLVNQALDSKRDR